MINISRKDINQIEQIILPKNCNFTEEQIQVILSKDSADIEACPGSGKTTVLISKLALLFNQLRNNKDGTGICVITHTNVGVDEIRNRLYSLGIKSIEYPHFLGTIHEFFNYFFTNKAYSKVCHHSEISFVDDTEYKKIFKREFNNYKPYWWKSELNENVIYSFDLKITNEGVILTGLEDSKPKYRELMTKTAIGVFKKGILRHKHTLTLSDWYISVYKEKLFNAFKERFKILFIDETQDTSLEQYNLLESIFNKNETIIQRFGDPYQALYNIYGKGKDAWVPRLEETLQLAESSRFGNEIAKVLRTTCIKEYKHLKGNVDVQSFKPHLFLFNEENRSKLLSVYAQIINNYENVNEEFRLSRHKVYAICRNHNELIKYDSTYDKREGETKQSSLINTYRKTLISILIRGVKNQTGKFYSIQTFEKHFKQNDPEEIEMFNEKLASWIKELSSNSKVKTQLVYTELEIYYKYFINKLFNIEIENIDLTSELNWGQSIINMVTEDYDSSEKNLYLVNTYKYDDITINLNTIHGVKGETHKATLILESSIGYDKIGGSDLFNIYKYLFGNYVENDVSLQHINDMLKLAYVGISRPTHLAAVAINENNFVNSQGAIKMARDSGWEIINISTYLNTII